MTGLICCTLNCNLACSYCYEGNGKICKYPDLKKINSEFKNSMKNIIEYLDQLCEYNGDTLTRVIWHGGEPTLINCELLDVIMQDQKEKGHNIMWALQTNGTLITEKYTDVLSKHNVSVGISIDGLREQHNRYRVFKNGKPTYDIIMNNVDKLQKRGLTVGGLVTITDNNIDNLIDIYKMFALKKNEF